MFCESSPTSDHVQGGGCELMQRCSASSCSLQWILLEMCKMGYNLLPEVMQMDQLMELVAKPPSGMENVYYKY